MLLCQPSLLYAGVDSGMIPRTLHIPVLWGGLLLWCVCMCVCVCVCVCVSVCLSVCLGCTEVGRDIKIVETECFQLLLKDVSFIIGSLYFLNEKI